MTDASPVPMQGMVLGASSFGVANDGRASGRRASAGSRGDMHAREESRALTAIQCILQDRPDLLFIKMRELAFTNQHFGECADLIRDPGNDDFEDRIFQILEEASRDYSALLSTALRARRKECVRALLQFYAIDRVPKDLHGRPLTNGAGPHAGVNLEGYTMVSVCAVRPNVGMCAQQWDAAIPESPDALGDLGLAIHWGDVDAFSWLLHSHFGFSMLHDDTAVDGLGGHMTMFTHPPLAPVSDDRPDDHLSMQLLLCVRRRKCSALGGSFLRYALCIAGSYVTSLWRCQSLRRRCLTATSMCTQNAQSCYMAPWQVTRSTSLHSTATRRSCRCYSRKVYGWHVSVLVGIVLCTTPSSTVTSVRVFPGTGGPVLQSNTRVASRRLRTSSDQCWSGSGDPQLQRWGRHTPKTCLRAVLIVVFAL